MISDEKIEQWFLQYVDAIYNFLIYYTGNHDVEDIIQEVFIKVIKLENFNEVTTPKTYLFKIARNTAIDHIRKNRKVVLRTEEELVNIAAHEKLPEDVLLMHEDYNRLLECMSSMKKTYRDVLVLRLVNEMTFDEIAYTLSWNVSKVKTTFYRAIHKLRAESVELREVEAE